MHLRPHPLCDVIPSAAWSRGEVKGGGLSLCCRSASPPNVQLWSSGGKDEQRLMITFPAAHKPAPSPQTIITCLPSLRFESPSLFTPPVALLPQSRAEITLHASACPCNTSHLSHTHSQEKPPLCPAHSARGALSLPGQRQSQSLRGPGPGPGPGPRPPALGSVSASSPVKLPQQRKYFDVRSKVKGQRSLQPELHVMTQ